MTKTWRLSHWLAAAAAVVACVVLLLPTPEGVPREVMWTAGVVILTVGLWATAAFPEYLTAIIFFVLAMTLGIAPANVVFSGFHSSAVWVVFGGLVIGVAVQSTGFGARLARITVHWFRGSYLAILTGVVLLTAMMAFLMPSATGRIMILVPIVLALADRLGYGPGSNGRTAMTLAVGGATLYPAFGILPAAVPNLGLLGAAESIYGINITYFEYLRLHFPVIGPLSILVLPLILRVMFPDTQRRAERATDGAPITRDEIVLVVVLGLALVLWMTDTLHGVSPAWIAMGAAVLCLLPRVGMVPPSAVVEKVNFGPWFFVAGVIGMGAVVTSSGLGEQVGRLLFSLVELRPGQDALNFAAVVAIGMGVGVAVGMPGQPAIMSALAPAMSEATGWPLLSVLMAQMPSWPMAIFPYELPPIVVAMYLGGIPMRQVTRLLLVMTLFGWLVVLPLQYLWWRYLGYFG